MAKIPHFRKKILLKASYKDIKQYTYGYFLEDKGHLTSFAYGTEEEASTFMPAQGTFSKPLNSCKKRSKPIFNSTKMAKNLQGRHQQHIGATTTKKWKKNCEAKYDVAETSQNQNGVIFFSSLKMQQKSP